MSGSQPIKDEENELPVAGEWRATFGEVVRAFVEGDYGLTRGVSRVAPVTADTAKQIEDYVADYGETLVELPDETWQTSISLWHGTHWEVLVDLWTAEGDASDLVLRARVFEDQGGHRFEIEMVYVP